MPCNLLRSSRRSNPSFLLKQLKLKSILQIKFNVSTNGLVLTARIEHCQPSHRNIIMAAVDLLGIQSMQMDPMGSSSASPNPQNEIVFTESEVDERVHLIAESDQNPNQKDHSKSKIDSSTLDICTWYMRNPIEHLPILYFFAFFLGVPLLSIFCFMEQDIAYLIAGPLILTMCIYAIHKFKTSIALKSEVGKFQRNNQEMRTQLTLLEEEVERMKIQHETLKDAKQSIIESFERNKENLERFKNVEEDMKMFGAMTEDGVGEMIKRTSVLNAHLEQSMIEQERDMMFAAYNMVERQRTDRKDFGMTDFEEFKQMLPSELKSRFMEKTDFEHIIHCESIVNYESFVKILDDYGMQFLWMVHILMTGSLRFIFNVHQRSKRTLMCINVYQSTCVGMT